MSYQGTKINKLFIPVYYGDKQVTEGIPVISMLAAEAAIKERATEAFYDRDDKFEYAEVKIRYVPEEVWEWDE